mmetsp:Transcript_56211/g.155600  ORF Transcript_56211/g.155600 Transcript_56211/m.155600 type:complete len:219 (+) Transcript_56211:2-658(+)
MPVTIKLVKATGLPRADSADHSDPFCVIQVAGKRRSRTKSKVVMDSENPLFNEEIALEGWKKGETIVITFYDHDSSGSHDKLAAVEIPCSQFYPKPFSGMLTMKNLWVDDNLKLSRETRKYNATTVPKIELAISVESRMADTSDEDEEVPGAVEAHEELAMPNAEPSMQAVCDHLRDFGKKTTPVPHLGNFWMHPSVPKTSRRAKADPQSAGVVQSAR